MLQNNDEINLWESLTVLTKHKKLMATVMALSVGIGLLACFTATKYYRATAVVRNGFFLTRTPNDSNPTETTVLTITDAEILLKSRDILESALAEANLKLDQDSLEYFKRERLRITQIKKTKYIRIEVESASPKMSLRMAELLSEKYIAHGNALLGKIFEQFRSQLQEVETEMAMVRNDISKSRAVLAGRARGASNGATLLMFQEPLPQMQLNLQSLLAQKSELLTMMLRSEDFRIIDGPKEPLSPSKPHKMQILLIAILVGMVLSIVAAMIAENFNS